jgi:hypothetical protein
VSAAWGDANPGDFTNKPMDVVFKVNAGAPYLAGTHSVWLVGGNAPLSFVRPGLKMKDDGIPPDQTAGDKIFTLKVRFPKCTPKNVEWKVVYDSTVTDTVYECPGQGSPSNRTVYLNDAVYDTTGGLHGPLTLPARGLNRCKITDKAVAVTFRVQMRSAGPPFAGATDTVAVIGGHSPNVTGPTFPFPLTVPPTALSRLLDNGVAPDARANDWVFTKTIVFPESTGTNVNFKYWYSNFGQNFGYERQA